MSNEKKIDQLLSKVIEIDTKVETLIDRGCEHGARRVEVLREAIFKEIKDQSIDINNKFEKTTKHIKTVGALSYSIGAVTGAFLSKFFK